MGFSQALSGLSAQDENLKIISNNIANSQTVGFKSSKASFADVFAGANSRVGLGTSIAAVRQDFASGDLENTGRNLDLAIAGDGFYRLETPTGEVVFSRNGQFSQDANGFLVNANGQRLTGFGLSDANDPFSEIVAGGAPQAIRIPGNDIPANATTKATATFNFDASVDPSDASLLQRASILTDADDPESEREVPYHFASSFTAYDSLGNEKVVTTYFRKVGDNDWQAHVALDGVIEDFSLVAQSADDLDLAAWQEALEKLDSERVVEAAQDAGFTTSIPSMITAIISAVDQDDDGLTEDGLEFVRDTLSGESLSTFEEGFADEGVSDLDALKEALAVGDLNLNDIADGLDLGIKLVGEGFVYSAQDMIAAIVSSVDQDDDGLTEDGLEFVRDTLGGDSLSTFETGLADEDVSDLDALKEALAVRGVDLNAIANQLDLGIELVDGQAQVLLTAVAEVDTFDGLNALSGQERDEALDKISSAFSSAVFNDEYDFNQVASWGKNAFSVGFANNGQLSRNTQGEVNAVRKLNLDGDVQPGAPSSAATLAFSGIPGGADDLEFDFDILGSTQFNNNSVQNSLTQNGYTSGTLSGIEVLDDGTVVRNYTNEQVREAGQIVLGTFANMEGLQPEGDNAWRPTNESGEPVLGIAGTGMFGSIASGVLENSNVDLARELVNMIVAQRAYQANSSSIGTRDELLQTVINL